MGQWRLIGDVEGIRRLVSRIHTKEAAILGVVLGAGCVYVARQRNGNGKHHKDNTTVTVVDPAKRKHQVDQAFLKQLVVLLRVVFPSWKSKQVLLLALHLTALVSRTFLSVYVAKLDGLLVRAIVSGELKRFLYRLSQWLLIALPATFVNSLIRYLESQLALQLRSALTTHAYGLYFANRAYYRVSNMDSRLSNPDQCLTEDIAEWCQSISHLFSHITKPLLDVTIISYMLLHMAWQKSTGTIPSAIIGIGMTGFTARVLRAISPRFGQLVASEAAKKGQLRYVHSRLIENAEEVAFYNGHAPERDILWHAYGELRKHSAMIYKKRLWYVWMEQFLMKYCWSASGMLMVAMPIFFSRAKHRDGRFVDEDPDGGVSERTQAFTTSKSLLQSAGDACERLMSSYKEITELSGYTSRVHDLLSVLEDCQDGRYYKPGVSSATAAGMVHENSDFIQLDNVPVITPNGDEIVRDLSLRLNTGQHLLITGPNGCGKSSLFRVLSDLWPVYGGVVHRPPPTALFYIPQRPYMSIGSFRDQLTYPHTRGDLRKAGVLDDSLLNILRLVELEKVLLREGGWDAKSDWKDVLSGGEKQRLGLARLFYHQPKFALLDECTSQVSVDVEGRLYAAMKERGITLLTITHRQSLFQFHSHILRFDGVGNWEFAEMTENTTLGS